jgi:two-component system, NtrC family, sensor kinase
MNLKRLRLVLVLSFGFLSIVPLFFVGYKIKTEGAEMIKEKVFSHLLSVSDKSSYIIMEFLSERRSDLRMLSSLLSLQPDMDAARAADHFRLMKKKYNVYLGFMVADSDGEVSYSDSRCFERESPVRGREWFVRARRGGEYMSDIFTVEADNRTVPVILAAVPVSGSDGTASRVLAACIDFSKIDISLSKTEIGITGEVYVVNKDGRFITSSRLGANILEDEIPINEKKDPLSQKGVYELIDYRGERVLHAYNEISDNSWIVIAEQDKDEALSQINDLNTKIFIMGFMLVVLIIAVALFVSGRIVRFIEKAYNREKELEFQVIQKEKLAALGLFTAGLAHELNTPLANALLYTQMIAEDMDPRKDSGHLERLETIEEEIKHGSRIVRNFLEFSRHSRGERQFTSVNDVIDKLITIAQPHCSSKGIKIVRELQKGIPPVKGEPSIIQEVITNVFANACDVMQQGGVLGIRTRYSTALKKVKIDVSDTGPGIPPDAIHRVFDPFFSTKEQGEGTGLGLFMSYEMVHKIGGTIRVISSKNQEKNSEGTVFTIELPVSNESNNL